MGPLGDSWLDRGRSSPQHSRTPSFELFVRDGVWQLANREDGSTLERREELRAAISISNANL